MKRTYTGTLFHVEDLAEAKVFLEVYNGCKYTEGRGEPIEFEFKGLTAWDIIEGGAEAEAIEQAGDILDENHEYLVLHFANGLTQTYRNSHVSLFII